MGVSVVERKGSVVKRDKGAPGETPAAAGAGQRPLPSVQRGQVHGRKTSVLRHQRRDLRVQRGVCLRFGLLIRQGCIQLGLELRVLFLDFLELGGEVCIFGEVRLRSAQRLLDGLLTCKNLIDLVLLRIRGQLQSRGLLLQSRKLCTRHGDLHLQILAALVHCFNFLPQCRTNRISFLVLLFWSMSIDATKDLCSASMAWIFVIASSCSAVAFFSRASKCSTSTAKSSDFRFVCASCQCCDQTSRFCFATAIRSLNRIS